MARLRLKPEKIINTIVARDKGVHGHIMAETQERGNLAEARLARHHYSGHAEIDVFGGQVDGYVVLRDERGQRAAAAIEYGRRAYYREFKDRHGNVRKALVPASRGVGALAIALGKR